jgi:hypothetical protein
MIRRRRMLQATSAGALLPTALEAGEAELDPVPPLPVRPTAGRAGDFDFLAGRWRIDHWRRPAGASEWDRFKGEATCWTILAGVGSVEELRIPERGFSGMGLRLLDLKQHVWSDFWVNAKSGVLTAPGQTGSFENGVGLFVSDFDDAGKPMKSAGIWDRITPDACRWRQVVSADGGKTWTHDWIMHWRRV